MEIYDIPWAVTVMVTVDVYELPQTPDRHKSTFSCRAVYQCLDTAPASE